MKLKTHPELDIETILSQAAPQADGSFRRRLRRRLLSQYDKQYEAQYARPAPRWRDQIAVWPWRLIAAGLGLFLLILAISPPGQVLAEALLRFGPFVFTTQPTAVEKHLASLEDNPAQIQRSQIAAAAAEASQIAGFPVYYPGYLPAGYQADPNQPIDVVFNSAGQIANINAMFFKAKTDEAEDENLILYYSQTPIEPDPDRPPYPFGIGKASIEAVTVRGNEGVWLENLAWGTTMAGDGELVAVPYNLLIWEETLSDELGGETFQFWLSSQELLPLETMQQVAESLER